MEQMILEFFETMRNPFLDGLFYSISVIADQWSYLLLFGMIYWCFNKKLGIGIGVALLFSSAVNIVVKEYFREPRPFQVLDIKAFGIETAKGYSFPSGHAQSASSFFTFLSLRSSKKWIGVGIFVTVAVALSRLYLSVHWPKDVIYGITIGMILSGVLFFVDRISSEHLMGTFAVVILTAPFFLHLPVNLLHNPLYTGVFGAIVGAVVGAWFESRFVKFGPARTVFSGIGRMAFGVIVTSASFVATYYFFQNHPWIYHLIPSFVATGLIPLAFEKEMKKYY